MELLHYKIYWLYRLVTSCYAKDMNRRFMYLCHRMDNELHMRDKGKDVGQQKNCRKDDEIRLGFDDIQRRVKDFFHQGQLHFKWEQK